jgi:hypothetical protein
MSIQSRLPEADMLYPAKPDEVRIVIAIKMKTATGGCVLSATFRANAMSIISLMDDKTIG